MKMFIFVRKSEDDSTFGKIKIRIVNSITNHNSKSVYIVKNSPGGFFDTLKIDDVDFSRVFRNCCW